jgi:peroxiredoxin
MRTPPAPSALPADLPVPVDDGATDHLRGQALPALKFRSSNGGQVNLHELAQGALVLYVFPAMTAPSVPDPKGWDQIPGARGCTQESCAFRDRADQFRDLGYAVVGLSAQTPAVQREAWERLQLDFPLLADPDRLLGEALSLPTFEKDGTTYYKRLTIVARNTRIAKVFYPVFPPDENAEEVLRWIRQHGSST